MVRVTGYEKPVFKQGRNLAALVFPPRFLQRAL
jgi:hypothetical protein